MRKKHWNSKANRKETIHLVVRKRQAKEPERDYLKFYAVMEDWAKSNYGLNPSDLRMLFFLRTEYMFSKTDFEDYAKIFSWDKKRFERLKKDGFIEMYRKARKDQHALYNLSKKGKMLVDNMYKYLNGDKDYSEYPNRNAVMKSTAGFAAKRTAEVMKMINERNRKRRLEKIPHRRHSLANVDPDPIIPRKRPEWLKQWQEKKAQEASQEKP